jgi:hypothetical protein
MNKKMYFLAILAFAMATFLLVHFGMIWAYGRFYIYESNHLILLAETTLIIAILGFAAYCIIEQVIIARTQNNRATVKARAVYLSEKR